MKEREQTDGFRALSRLELYVTIVGTILGLLFTWSQLRIARSEEARAQRAEPLSYMLQAVDTHYVYELAVDGSEQTIAAPSLRLQVTHGSLHAVTAISYDGEELYQMATLPIQDDWKGCGVDITLPAQAIEQEGDTIYDYFFLYLEPVEGEAQPDLICNAISVEKQAVTSHIMHRIDLVRLESQPQRAQREMLEVYAKLSDRLAELGLLSK